MGERSSRPWLLDRKVVAFTGRSPSVDLLWTEAYTQEEHCLVRRLVGGVAYTVGRQREGKQECGFCTQSASILRLSRCWLSKSKNHK